MATVIYNCKSCKVGKRVDYPLGDRNHGFYRIDSGGKRIDACIYIAARRGAFVEYAGDMENGLCRVCFRAMEYGQLKASLRPEVPCSAICMGARGHNCDCSCGGANHGKAA